MKKLTAPSFANFSEYDLIRALILIHKEALGRNLLMRELGLSEASTRSLMKKLSSSGFVKTTTKGIALTDSGKNFVHKVNTILSGPAPINYGAFSISFKVSDSANMVNVGLEQRDAAVKAGAAGCLVFVYKNSRLVLPGVDGIEHVYLDIFNGVKENFSLSEGDVVIIAFANTKRHAELGAWEAVKTLLIAKDI